MNELIFGNKRFDVDDADNIIIDEVRYGQSLWINFQENFRSLHGRRYEQVQVNFRDSNTLALAAISSSHTRFWNAVVVFSSKLMKTLILSQFDGSQMIAHIMLDSISPCSRCLPSQFRNFASQFVTRIVNGCRTNFILALKATRSRRLFKGARIRESHSSKMYLINRAAILHISRLEQLQNKSKVVFFRVYDDYIEHVWDKLPEHSGGLFGDSNYSLRRVLQPAVAADAHRPSRVSDKGL